MIGHTNQIGSGASPHAAEVEPPATRSSVTAGGSATPSAAKTYLHIRHHRLCDLLGRWVSEIDPLVFERLDVSPHVLAQIGLAAPGHSAPQLVAEVTASEVASAMGMPL